MDKRPRPISAVDPETLAEALEALVELPDEVRDELDGVLPRSVIDREEMTPLLIQGLGQAGYDRTDVEMQVLQIQIEHLKQDLKRLEETWAAGPSLAVMAQSVERLEKAEERRQMSETRVIGLILIVTIPLIAAVDFLHNALH